MSPRRRPNVLLVMSDQHHAGIMGCAGDRVAHTPSLDRLAAGGTRFRNAYCTYPLCAPSRMSFLTGRHPHELGLFDNEGHLGSDIPTLAHAFLSAGYDTVLSGRMHFVGPDQRHGYRDRIVGDVAESAYSGAGLRLGRILGDLADTPGMGLAGVIKSGPGRTGYHAYDEVVTRATVRWLGERGRGEHDRPFLLTVGYVAPHCPFVSPPGDFRAHRDRIGYADLPPPDDHLHPVNAAKRGRWSIDPPPPRDAQWRSRVAYYGLCTFLDRQVGTILTALAESGLREHTIIVYCSDHGEMLGEHGMWWKSTFYDGASRVPLIVSWPGHVPTGQVRAENVSLLDLGPTLLDLCDVDALPGASGTSFRGLLTGADTSRKNTAWKNTAIAEHAERGSPVACRMVRSGGWKLNYYHGLPPELFQMQEDPGETTDLAGSTPHREVERRLTDLALLDWNPDDIAARMQRRSEELSLIGTWERTARPPEPDPPWFSGTLENRVDTDVTGVTGLLLDNPSGPADHRQL